MIVVDVETSGKDPKKHSILSVGAVDFLEPKRQFYGECKMFEGAEIDDRSLETNGFTKEQIIDEKKMSVGELMKEFIAWFEASEIQIIAGHNSSFDRDSLNESAKRSGLEWRVNYRTVDLHSVCYAHLCRRGIRRKTTIEGDKILEYVGLPKEPKPHIAINGAKWEAEAFSRLLFGKGLLDEFIKYAIPSYL